MNLYDFGFSDELAHYITENKLSDFSVGRVTLEHRDRYIVSTGDKEYEAEITGNLRFSANSSADFPAVGDWVTLTTYEPDLAIIHKILPRYSIIKRQAVGQFGEVQIIAANIDYAFLVQAADRDFNINRLERYLTICYSSGVKPIILLTKTDLINADRISEILEDIKTRIKNVQVIAISNATHSGYEVIKASIEKGKTYCLLGSSGVGKSTLLNNLSGKPALKTDTISRSTNKGRHVTSHRELIILEGGGILVDNPGMREVGIADKSSGLETTFDKIITVSQNCRFKNCTHTSETGCAVLEAIENGEIDKLSFENYLKMEKEKAHFESTVAERKRKEKIFGKIIKDYQKKDVKQRKN